MTLGADIKEVLVDVGVSVTVFRTPENIVGEYVKTKVNAQVTKPFIREFFLEVQLAYDTQIVAGDALMVADGRIFLVMNKTPELFEGEIYRYSAVFYKCNVEGALYRPSVNKANYQSQLTGSLVHEPCYALLTESRYGHELDDDAEVGPVSLASIDCYLPHSVGAAKGDRFVISSDEYYQVESIRLRRFEAIDLLALGEDRRGVMA